MIRECKRCLDSKIRHATLLYACLHAYLGGRCRALRLQPLADRTSLTLYTSISREPKATTVTAGSPSTYSPVITSMLRRDEHQSTLWKDSSAGCSKDSRSPRGFQAANSG